MKINALGQSFHMPPRTDHGTHAYWTVKNLDGRYGSHEAALAAAEWCGDACNEVSYHVEVTFTLDSPTPDQFERAMNAQLREDYGEYWNDYSAFVPTEGA